MCEPKRDDKGDLRNIRALQELFKGRFTEREIATLYENKSYDLAETANFILEAEPGDISKLLEEEEKQWQTVQKTVKEKKKSLSKDVIEQVKKGVILTAARLFACGPCDKVWWTRVPTRKQVSTCKICKKRCDAVDKDKEWGWALFKCPCGSQFGGFCRMGIRSQCYRCHQYVNPTIIQPPRKPDRRKGPYYPKNVHNCEACSGLYDVNLCAHPLTRRNYGLPNVMHESEIHDSTGSTVNTFLPQQDLRREYYDVYGGTSTLGSITEESSSDGD